MPSHPQPDGSPGLAFAGAAVPLREFAALLGCKPVTVRAWLRHGLLGAPGAVAVAAAAEPRLPVAQLARGRLMLRFHAAGWSASRVARALQRLHGDVRDLDRQLAALQGALDTGTLAQRLDDGRLQDARGQQLFDFEARSSSVRALRGRAEWFQTGVQAEAEGRLDAAIRAYQVAAAAGDPVASFNLGNCHYSARDFDPAIAAYRRSVHLDPGYAEAWNNLGIALGERGDAASSEQAYRSALEVAPHYADAHFNLAELLAGLGQLDAARRHWRAYLSYDPNSRWAEQVRRRLGLET